MKKLFKGLACISLVLILSASIVSATDEETGKGMCNIDDYTQKIAV